MGALSRPPESGVLPYAFAHMKFLSGWYLTLTPENYRKVLQGEFRANR
jgi:hypothetical protein